MSDKIYTRLLRLYPSSFRKDYEDEALQLIRDRLRDETGVFKRTRLWWDLLADVLIGLPSAYRNSYAVTKAASRLLNTAGTPSFKTLDEAPLGLGPILVGGTLSLIALAAFAFLLTRSIAYQPIPSSNGRMSPIESVMQRLNSAPAPDSGASSLQDATTAATHASEPQAQPSTPGASTAKTLESPSEAGIPPKDVNAGPRVATIKTSTPNALAPPSEAGIPPKDVNAGPRVATITSTPNASASPPENRILPKAVNAGPRVAAIKTSKPYAPSKMSFDSVSIKQSKPGKSAPMPNFALDNGDAYAPFPDPRGRFAADFPLPVFIRFAYKLSLSPEQIGAMLARSPKWVATDYFEIHAKAEGNPTKDQMRLMMQSLLGDRFKLAIHFETKSTKAPMDVLVVDHVERPSEN